MPSASVVELIVLGSGSPFASPRRVSSGYILRSELTPPLLIDAGGGTFERLGRSGIAAVGLDPMLLTHMHIDHSAGLAAIINSAFMEGRTDPVTIVGPAGRDDQPGIAEFCELLFGKQGAWRFLRTFDGFDVRPIEAPSDPKQPTTTTVLERAGISVRSVAVPHGMMPSVAYRIELAGRAIVVSGDVQSEYQPLVSLATGCDVLIYPLAVPEREVEQSHLFTKPSAVGRIARDCGCELLVLTHVFPLLDTELEAALAHVRGAYEGRMIVAEDLMRIAI